MATIRLSKSALRSELALNHDNFPKLMELAGVYREKPHLYFKKTFTDRAEYDWCKKRIQRYCFIVVKKK